MSQDKRGNERRMWRLIAVVARRTFAVALATVVAIGALSACYDFLTRAPVGPPTGLKYIRTGAYQTRYLVWGSSGPSVVLVPGFLESADTWTAVAQRLAVDHHVVSYDVAGFGYTDRVGPYGTAAAADQLLQLMAALGLERPVLVGHSAGAAIIAAVALKAPKTVGGLVFVDGDGLTAGAGPPRALLELIRDPLRTALMRLLVRSDWFIRAVYSQQCGPKCARLDAAGIEQWRRPLQAAGSVAALWGIARAGGFGLSADQLARLKPLMMPKAVVFGASDQVFGASAPETTAARIGAPSSTRIPGARHLAMISDPATVAGVIDQLVMSFVVKRAHARLANNAT